MANTVAEFSNTKIIDTGSAFEINYAGTVRLVINKASGAVSLGAVDGTGQAMLYISQGTVNNDLSVGNMKVDTNGMATKANVNLTIATTNDKDIIFNRNNSAYITFGKDTLAIEGSTPIEFKSSGVFDVNGVAPATLDNIPVGASATSAKWLKIKDSAGGTAWIPVWTA